MPPSPWGALIGTPMILCSLWGEGWWSTTPPEHDSLRDVQLQSLLDHLNRVPLT